MNTLRLVSVFILLLALGSSASAGKPNCSPWPACKDGGGDPTEPPAGNPVILAEDEGGNARLVAMDADGSNVVTVLKEGWDGESAQWAPGGTYVAYLDISTNVGSGICPTKSLHMVPYDENSNTWGRATCSYNYRK